MMEHECTLKEYLNDIYERNVAEHTKREYISKGVHNVKFSDCTLSIEELFRAHSEYLPEHDLILNKLDIENNEKPVIFYSIDDANSHLSAECNICSKRIYTPCFIHYDKSIETFEEAYKREFLKMGFWTTDGWLLCRFCADNCKRECRYTIDRPFTFRGDLPRGRSMYKRPQSHLAGFRENERGAKPHENMFRDE